MDAIIQRVGNTPKVKIVEIMRWKKLIPKQRYVISSNSNTQ